MMERTLKGLSGKKRHLLRPFIPDDLRRKKAGEKTKALKERSYLLAKRFLNSAYQDGGTDTNKNWGGTNNRGKGKRHQGDGGYSTSLVNWYGSEKKTTGKG